MRSRLFALLVLVVLALTSCTDDTEFVAGDVQTPTEDAVTDSVVRIVGSGCGAPALGSGFAIDENLIVTSGHIVTGRDPATLGIRRPDGTEASAILVGFDPDLDLAVLRVDGVRFEPVTLLAGESDDIGVGMTVGPEDEIREVDFVVDAPVTVNWDGVYRDTESTFRGLRLDAQIQRGDSGGGLFVSRTEVIGLIHSKNRAGLPRGYAVSSTQIETFIDTIDPAVEVTAPRCL